MKKGPRKSTRPSQTPLVLYPRDLKKMEAQTWDMMFTLVSGYLMDELDYDEDKIIDLWKGIERYMGAVKDHTITLKRVKEIINECTGLKVMGNGRVETNKEE